MTPIRKIVFGAIVALPVFLAPTSSQAGGFQSDSSNFPNPPSNPNDCCPVNNVTNVPPPTGPIDSGMVFIFIAGLGLGVMTVYAKTKKRVAGNKL